MNTIEQRIQQKLTEIEQTEHVRILHCVESGSRAWGFASPDSDYDVRFIYIREPKAYLRLEGIRDVIEWQLDDVYDINGWDVQKFLRLLYKSNPTVFEWNSSPIIYRTTPEWEEIAAMAQQYFVSKASLHHYLSMARTNYRVFLKGDEVYLKKYFYVLRPILACRWILDKGTPPPMLFEELAAAELPASIRPQVGELLRLKRETPEIGTGPRVDALNAFIEQESASLDAVVATLVPHVEKDWDTLDQVFWKLLGVSGEGNA